MDQRASVPSLRCAASALRGIGGNSTFSAAWHDSGTFWPCLTTIGAQSSNGEIICVAVNVSNLPPNGGCAGGPHFMCPLLHTMPLTRFHVPEVAQGEGGLGDEMAALPKGLQRRGHRVMVVVPWCAHYKEAYDTGAQARFNTFGSSQEVRLRLHKRVSVHMYVCMCVAEGGGALVRDGWRHALKCRRAPHPGGCASPLWSLHLPSTHFKMLAC